MNDNRRTSQKGQSLVLVALLILGLLGLMAVVLDGGNLFYQQRIAQNAADAAALAGAREWCITHSEIAAYDMAVEYALDHNNATEADVTVAGGQVTVVARIPFRTWFGAILGRPTMTANATAAAGCFLPRYASSVLPVAWSCRPSSESDPFVIPTGGPEIFGSYCRVNYDHNYIVMDSRNTESDVFCIDPPNTDPPPAGQETYLDCDFDNDNIDDAMSGGDRSWLDLTGGASSAAEMIDWIENGLPTPIETHSWVSGKTGVQGSVFQTVGELLPDRRYVVIPVFDKFCNEPGIVPEVGCPSLYEAGDTTIAGTGATDLYFHIITFSYFEITCVDAGGGNIYPPGMAECPGRQQAISAGYYGSPTANYNNLKTIEGHFEYSAFIPEAGGILDDGSGMNAGLWTLYLTR